jgi:hypothetical protein
MIVKQLPTWSLCDQSYSNPRENQRCRVNGICKIEASLPSRNDMIEPNECYEITENVLLRPTKAAVLLRSDGGVGHLADGDAGSVKCGGEPRRSHAAAPGADGEEIEVVLSLGGSAIGGLRGRRDVAAGGEGSAGEPRGGGKGKEVEEAAAEVEWTARGECAA